MVLLSTSFANIALTVALAAVKPAYEGTKHSSKMSLKIPRKLLTGSQDHLSWVQEAMKVKKRGHYILGPAAEGLQGEDCS
jgi:hypothetical protein